MESRERASLWLTLAQEKLQVARELFALSRFDDAVSKAYYVMFYAARAALAAEGIEARRHSGTIAFLNQEFVRRGRLDSRYLRLLARAMQAREISDYDPASRASQQDAEAAILDAEEFLEALTRLVDDAFP